MHWHYEVFALKGLLIYIHTYTWGHLLTLLNPGDSEVVKYNILSKMCDTIERISFKKISASANMLHLRVIFQRDK